MAGCGVLASPDILLNAVWFIDDCSFNVNLKLLPLTHFDIILGMDWLEQYSPMQVIGSSNGFSSSMVIPRFSCKAYFLLQLNLY